MSSTNRFFRASTAVYSSVRAGLDAAFGHPKTAIADDGTEVVTVSCLPPVETARADGPDHVLVPVSLHDCAMPEVAPVLADLLTAGTITETTETEWFAAAQ